MNEQELLQAWLAEERIAHIHGWDFSHIHGRYEEEEDLPWDYRQVVAQYLTPEKKILDVDTGGGEFLLSLGHPYENTAATEGYPPNVALCRETLTPLGIDFRPADDAQALPFEAERFDIVLDRHGYFDERDLWRVLRPGGLFLTQQVGAENDRALVDLLLPGTPLPFPGQYADRVAERFRRVGFEVLRAEEAFRAIRFFDVGALVWFARVVQWEFPGFTVAGCLPGLREAQHRVERQGRVEGRIHRYLLAARKPE